MSIFAVSWRIFFDGTLVKARRTRIFASDHFLVAWWELGQEYIASIRRPSFIWCCMSFFKICTHITILGLFFRELNARLCVRWLVFIDNPLSEKQLFFKYIRVFSEGQYHTFGVAGRFSRWDFGRQLCFLSCAHSTFSPFDRQARSGIAKILSFMAFRKNAG